ncbi:hypothetical protein LTR64_003471 [Lithohypha guttulata]|uniref:uncharacterized protein n=1 Tax=Lithohypha guttulata TaxID=1690604 RepID=UPI002DDEE056|nr:hypothetical protein LTR51_000310 [Lithohypha guttulata]
MSSPTIPSGDPPPENIDTTTADVDADMEDIVQDPNATTLNTTSAVNDGSSTIGNDDAAPDSAQPPPTSSQTQTQNQQTQTQAQTQTQTQTQTQPSTTVPPPPQSRKDVTLREFLSKMDDYAPIIPDAVTAHYLTLAGLPPPNPHDPTGANTGATPVQLARLFALATQKFVADLAADAYQYSRIRASNSSAGNNPLAGGVPIGAPGVGGVGGAAGGAGGAVGKGAQNTQLGVQRAGFGGGGQGGSGQGKTVLTMEDLGMAVQEYGVNVRRGEFYR